MNYDKPLAAAIIGILSTIPFEIFTRILVLLGISRYSIYQLDSLVITLNRPTPILGFVVSSVIGGFGAVIMYYVLEKWGKPDHLIIKGVIFSLLIWAVLEFLFTSSIESKTIEIRPISDYYSHMFGSIVFGIILGFLFKKYLFKNYTPLKNQ